MADSTLSNLTASGALTGTELFYSDNGSADVKVTATQIRAFTGMALLASGTTTSVATLDVPLDSTGYSAFKIFKLYVVQMIPATDDAQPWIRLSDDGGATFEADASDYSWSLTEVEETAAPGSDNNGDAGDPQIALAGGVGNLADEGCSFEITIWNPASTTNSTRITWSGYSVSNGGSEYQTHGSGTMKTVGASTDIRFIFETGNIATGKWSLVGIA